MIKPQNFLKKSQNFGSRKSIKDFLGNKKADIAITILVIGVIALCVLALLIFYVSEERQKSEGINSFSYLQEVYNQAESARYSGESNINNYENVRYDRGFIVEKEFLNGGLKVKYILNP